MFDQIAIRSGEIEKLVMQSLGRVVSCRDLVIGEPWAEALKRDCSLLLFGFVDRCRVGGEIEDEEELKGRNNGGESKLMTRV